MRVSVSLLGFDHLFIETVFLIWFVFSCFYNSSRYVLESGLIWSSSSWLPHLLHQYLSLFFSWFPILLIQSSQGFIRSPVPFLLFFHLLFYPHTAYMLLKLLVLIIFFADGRLIRSWLYPFLPFLRGLFFFSLFFRSAPWDCAGWIGFFFLLLCKAVLLLLLLLFGWDLFLFWMSTRNVEVGLYPDLVQVCVGFI